MARNILVLSLIHIEMCIRDRLKTEEMKQLGWDSKRNLAKINYRIHTDAIKEKLIPPELSARQISFVYANEADVLNMALFLSLIHIFWR